MATTEDLNVLKFVCACNRVTGCVQVPSHELPLHQVFCHCNTCRHQAGVLAASFVGIPKTATNFEVNGPVTSYASSKSLSRNFCSHCGSNIYLHFGTEMNYDICSGVLIDCENVTKLEEHIFLADTKDGGLSAWLPDIPGWEQLSKSSKAVDCSTHVPAIGKTDISQNSELDCYCQCRGVEFKITRPTKASRESLSSPWSDLLSPYVSNPSASINSDDIKWWLRANDTKFLAGNCACNSCRLNSGFDLNQWAFVPKLNILRKDEMPLDYNDMGTLKQYESSKGCHRDFCSRCGATIFFHNDERPALVDVAVGVLDAEDGSRAESWLEWWTKRVSFSEDAQNKHLTASLLDGLKRWSTMEGASSNAAGA